MSNFIPHLFISVGETGAFFTLREAYLHESYVSGQVVRSVRSYHLYNLSQNADEAIKKATEASHRFGLELKTTRENLESEMREIQRATAVQIAERQARFEAQQRVWEAERQEFERERKEKIANGIFVFGPYNGQKFEEAPRGYISWMIDKIEDFEEGSVIRDTAEAMIKLVPHLAFPKPINLHVGEVKERRNFKATVIRVYVFFKPSFSGYGMDRGCVTTFVDESGACLVCFSGAIYLEEGQEVEFKATVKEHAEYKDTLQTVIQRVTLSK